ncbi:MAG: hypothetical protein LBN26_06985 [Christensenellaceae bacterium]|jgi:hypothetical protein|nr:hypothetical protein [Christensenellaceae bacterium]
MSPNNPNSPFMAPPNTFNMEASAPLDTKNLDILKDEMFHEALAYKKCMVYAQCLGEQPLKDMASDFAQHHKQHFDALQSFLNCHQ